MMFTVIKHTNQMTYKGPATHIFVPPDGGQGPGNIVPSRVVQMVSIKEQLYACAASEVMNRSLLKISRAKERRNPSKWNRVITKIHAPVQQSGKLETGQRVTQIRARCRLVKSNVHSQLLVVTKRQSPLADVSAPISRAKRGKLETGQSVQKVVDSESV